MASLSVSVMAHSQRKHLVPTLVKRLGIDDDQVSWDRHGNRWETGRRAWEKSSDADWHCVIQDDALVCEDFAAGLSQALDHVPLDCIVQPFVGAGRDKRGYRVAARAVEQTTKSGGSWLVMHALMWGVAIAAPAWTIPSMLDWCDKQDYPEYDRRVGQYYWRQLRWKVWHTHPSLVDHRNDTPSLADHGSGIVAHQFIGEDSSALSIDWSKGVMTTQQKSAAHRARVGSSSV